MFKIIFYLIAFLSIFVFGYKKTWESLYKTLIVWGIIIGLEYIVIGVGALFFGDYVLGILLWITLPSSILAIFYPKLAGWFLIVTGIMVTLIMREFSLYYLFTPSGQMLLLGGLFIFISKKNVGNYARTKKRENGEPNKK
jgi:hypothetical protein